jgi:hypothetical protein
MKTIAILTIFALPSCIVTSRPDGTTTRAIDGPALVTVVDTYYRIRDDK